MRLYFIISSLSFFLFLSGQLFSEVNSNILIKVGNKIITNYELKNKILSTLILSNQEINQENINNLKKQSIDSLIQKKIKQIELDRYELKADQVRVENYLKRVSLNDVDTLKKKFNDNQISFNLFLEEIEIQFAWQQLIFNTYASKIEIDKNNLAQEMDVILNKQQNILEFKLSEIEILINNNDQDKEKISNLINLINENGFEDVALKFSISTTAERKGNLGWINSKSLSEKIFSIVNNLNIGEISDPIIKQGSATIFKLDDKRVSKISEVDIDKIRLNLINRKRNELFDLYSQSLLSKLKNTTLIEYQ